MYIQLKSDDCHPHNNATAIAINTGKITSRRRPTGFRVLAPEVGDWLALVSVAVSPTVVLIALELLPDVLGNESVTILALGVSRLQNCCASPSALPTWSVQLDETQLKSVRAKVALQQRKSKNGNDKPKAGVRLEAKA